MSKSLSVIVISAFLLLPVITGCVSTDTETDSGSKPKNEILLSGGNMEDESVWKVSHLDSVDESEYEFNYTGNCPSQGSGGCLHVWGNITEATNIIFWQELSLEGASEYEISGAFADFEGSITNFWCEILVGIEPPPETPGVDYEGSIALGFNTWDGSAKGIDGTFQDDYAKGPGPIYKVPGKAGEYYKIYFVLNVGVWAGGTPLTFDVGIDELNIKKL